MELGSFNVAIASNDISQIEEFIKEFSASAFVLECHSKIEIIKEQGRKEKALRGLPIEWQSVVGFKNIAKRIPIWQKRQINQEIPEAFIDDLKEILKGIIKIELNTSNTKKNWKGSLSGNRNWQKIEEWLGQSRAESLHNELNKL